MASVTVRVDGLQALGERMRKLSADMNLKGALASTGSAAQVIKELAISNIITNPSIDTGSLRDAVIVKRLGTRESSLTAEHIVTVRGRGKRGQKLTGKQRSAPHAHLVEFGTVNMAAEPFLRPAFNHGKEKAKDAMVDTLRKSIAKAGA